MLVLCLTVAVACQAQEHAAFKEGWIRQISPDGWLREFLQRQASGLTGHPEAISYPYNTCLWAGEIQRRNDSKVAKNWWRYEQSAYYTDGLLRLGYILDDPTFIHKGEQGIAYTLSHAASNGRLGSPKLESQWPMAVFFRAMKADYEYRHDPQIVKALERHYLSLSLNDLTKGRRHIVNLEGMLWTYGMTHNDSLLRKAEEAYNKGGFELDASVAGSDKYIHMHGVTYCEMLKIPMLLYAYTSNQRYLKLALNAEYKLERDHMLPDGVPSSAEFTLGKDVDVAHETCDIVDYTWSMGYFLMATGNAKWADRIEKAVYNAGLGAITKDFRALQYFSSVNQLISTSTSDNNTFKRGSTWMQYRPIHETECCAGNVHRLMPNFASRLWMRGAHGEVVAALYSPSTFRFCVGSDTVQVQEKTSYPFDEKITFTFHTNGKSVSFPFLFRLPEWCDGAKVRVNGKLWKQQLVLASYNTMTRDFRDGDRVEITLDMPAQLHHCEGQGFYVQRGPLLFSYAIPAQKTEDTEVHANMHGKKSENAAFKSWNIVPAGPYNYGIDTTLIAHKDHLKVKVARRNMNRGYPYDLENVPVKIPLKVRKVVWSLDNGRNPQLPDPDKVVAEDSVETIELVPYGATELRLTVFPDASHASSAATGSAGRR